MVDTDDEVMQQINQLAAFTRMRLSHLQLIANLAMHGEEVAPMDLDRLWELRDDTSPEAEAEIDQIRGTFTAALEVATQRIDSKHYS